MIDSEDIRKRLLKAIGQEHLLHQRAKEFREQAERWQRRAELALRAGEGELARLARQRWQQAVQTATECEEQCLVQAQTLRELKSRLRLVSSGPVRPGPEDRFARLEREERLERDLAALKASLPGLRCQ